MKQLGDGLFEVPSDSDASRTYIVNLTGDHPQCTCTAWAVGRNRAKAKGVLPAPCKHVRFVWAADKNTWRESKKREAEAKATAEAQQRETAKAELLKMRAELAGEPEPKPPEEPSLMALLEAAILANRLGPPGEYTVHHIDGNPGNNHPSNIKLVPPPDHE